MTDERLEAGEEISDEQAARRNFLRKSSRVAVAVPAVVLLLAAAGKSSEAQAVIYGTPGIE
jgi:hypothetical protein